MSKVVAALFHMNAFPLGGAAADVESRRESDCRTSACLRAVPQVPVRGLSFMISLGTFLHLIGPIAYCATLLAVSKDVKP